MIQNVEVVLFVRLLGFEGRGRGEVGFEEKGKNLLN